MEKIIIKGEGNLLYNHIISYTAGFIVVGIGFLITYCIIICCTICQKSCPPFSSWKRDLNKFPYKKSELNAVTFVSLGFAIATLIVCIYSLTRLGIFSSSIIYTKCAIYAMLDTTLNGDSTNNWGGMEYLSNQYSSIYTGLNSFQKASNMYFSDNIWLINDPKLLDSGTLNIYLKYHNQKVLSPNPATPMNTINPIFLNSSLGPNGT
jgi:hypothetical protein